MSSTTDPLVASYPRPAVLPPELLEFLDYWEGLRAAAGGAVPSKGAIDMMTIPRRLLPGIGLIDCLPTPDGGMRIYYRLLGTGHRHSTEHDYTGRYFDEIYTPEQVARLEAEYRAILAGGEPHYARRASLGQKRDFLIFQRFLAPLLDESGAARHLIGYWWWEPIRS
jgi:hypothetical protein